MNIIIQYNQKHLVVLSILVFLIAGGLYWRMRSTATQPQIGLAKSAASTSITTPQANDGINVDVTRLPGSNDNTTTFRIAFNTHSGDLSTFDVATNVTFRTASGSTTLPIKVGGDRETHHRTIEVEFKDLAFPGTLLINNLGSIKERLFKFI